MGNTRDEWMRKRRGRRQKRAQDGYLGDCPACGKKIFTSKDAAKTQARNLYPGRRMRIYKCPDSPGWWHLTSQSAEITTMHRERGER